jgi:hypothetical protein
MAGRAADVETMWPTAENSLAGMKADSCCIAAYRIMRQFRFPEVGFSVWTACAGDDSLPSVAVAVVPESLP